MNKSLKRIISAAMVLSLLMPSNFIKSAENIVKAASEAVTLAEDKYNESQVEYKFPEDNPTESIYTRNRRVFKGYEKRGSILVENHGAKSAEIYINGHLVDIKKVLENSNGKAVIDIGKYTTDGENSLKVINISPKESYINVKVFYPELVYGKPEEAGFSSEKLAKVDEFIKAEIEQGFPGAALVVVKDGKIIKNTAYGYKKKYDGYNLLEKFEEMNVDTMFDLASNSKMFATNLALQKLVYEGKLNVDDLVTKYIPGFKDGENDKFKYKSTIKVRDLLNHCAGFAPSTKFYDPKSAGELFSQDRQTTLKMLDKVPLIREPRTKIEYSDTDYMLLGYIIEIITGQREDEYVENNIYKPLGLTHTMYNPLDKGYKKEDTAATERNGNTRDGSVSFPNIRQYTLQGEVHDEKAWYSMAGVAGHAGLFSNTHDMAVLAQLILNGGGYKGFKLFDQDTLDKFTKPTDKDITYGLGWDRQGDLKKTWEFGPYASNLTIGHTGWTGTVTNIDPKNDMAVILLTNVRHTPCPNGSFEAYDKLQTGRYGSIMSLVYEALMENRKEGTLASDKGLTEEVQLGASQVDSKFPEDNPTSRILARYRRVFKAYKGRGEMTIENNGASSAEVYINGHRVDIASALKSSDGRSIINIGKYTVDGENSIKVLNVLPEKSFINVKIAYPELINGNAKAEGFSEERLLKLDELINSQIKGDSSSAALLVLRNGKVVKNTIYDFNKKYETGKLLEKTENTSFDSASATKVLTINLILQKLASEKKINIDDKVSKYISDFAGEGNQNITIRQLLTHSSGFAKDSKYYNQEYTLLGYIIEKVTGQKQEDYAENNIYKPLGLAYSVNNPNMKGLSKEDFAVLTQVLLNGGGYGGVKLFDKETLDQFVKPSEVKSTIASGWDRQGAAGRPWKFGAYASEMTYGYTDSNGISVLVDPKNDIAIVLLSSSKPDLLDSSSIMSQVYEGFMEKTSYSNIEEAEAAVTDNLEADSNILPKTGTQVDYSIMLILGIMLTLAGGAVSIKAKKENE